MILRYLHEGKIIEEKSMRNLACKARILKRSAFSVRQELIMRVCNIVCLVNEVKNLVNTSLEP